MGSDPFRVTRLRRQATPSTANSGSAAATSESSLASPPSIGTDSAASTVSAVTSDPSTQAPSPTSQAQNPPSTSFVNTPSASPSPSPPSSQDMSSTPSNAVSSSSAASSSAASSSAASSSASSSRPSSSAPSSSASLSSASSGSISSSASSSKPTSASSSSAITSNTQATTSSTPTSSISSASSTSTALTSSSEPSSSDTATSVTSSSSSQISSDSSTSLTTITSSIVTTIDGQATTIVTTFPTSLNSPPSTVTSGQRSGIIAGSAIGATLFVLLILSGLFVFYRRRARRKIAFAHRALPAPRSALLADEDAFDLAGPSQPMGEGVPQLLRPRGMETGSIFHEGVWPPPGERSRLEDPLLAGSNVDLTSIVESVMGQGHDRTSSADTAGSTSPLLGNFSPERADRTGGPPSAFANSASPSARKARSRLAIASDPSETTPLDPSGHAHQLSIDTDFGPSYSESHPLPPGAAAPVVRGKGLRPTPSVSTTGSPPSYLRGGTSGFGNLVVVNSTPELEQENALVDLTPSREEPPKEIPPLYHMIRKDTSDSIPPLGSNQSPASPPADIGQAL